MPYIGRELDRGNYLKLDDISSSFDGSTTTFNLTNGGNAFYPGSAFSILVVLAGVVQEPEAAYQINQAQITFASAPLAGDQFFCITLGQALGVNTPANGSVNGAQLAKPFNYDNYFYLDDANNRVGVGTATPMTPLHVEGTGRFTDLTVTGDLTVDGTTTTLDTVVTEVDKLEVGANNNTVGVAITQSGTGDILNLYDGSTEVFSVRDGGNVGIKNATGLSEFPVDVGGEIASKNANKEFIGINLTNNEARIRSSFYSGASGAYRPLTFYTSDAERLRIASNGQVGINTTAPAEKLDVWGTIRASEGTSKYMHMYPVAGAGYFDVSNSTTYPSIAFRQIGSGGTQERLRIASDGSVGIGTDNPQSQFEVYGTSPIVRSKHSTSQKYTQINHDGTDGYVDWSSGGLIFRGASNAERLRITSAGLVGIGTDDPSWGVSTGLIVGDGASARGITIFSNSANVGDLAFADATSGTGRYRGLIRYDHSDNSLTLRTNSSERLRISSAGNVGIGTDSPDNLLHLSGTNTTVWPFGSDVSGLYAYSPYPHELQIQNHARDVTGSFAGIYFHSGASPDGSYVSAARIAAIDSGNYRSDLAFGTRNTNFRERLRIRYDGNVGIGTNNPGVILDVRETKTAGSTQVRVYNTDNSNATTQTAEVSLTPDSRALAGAGIKVFKENADFSTNAGRDISLALNVVSNNSQSEALRITSGGAIAVGDSSQMGSNYARISIDCQGRDVLTDVTDVTNYGLAFHNDPDTNDANGIGFFNDDGTNCGGYILHQDKGSNNLGDLIFGTSETSNNPIERLRITSSGDVGIGTATPDKKLRVEGDARVTGTLTIGEASTVIDGSVEYPTIRPTLDLNFAGTKVLDDRITFTRDGVGTYIDENGILKYASNNTPRFDHDPVTGESLGLLIEESRTNILYGTPSQSNTVNTYNLYNSLTGEYNATRLAKNTSTNAQSHGSWSWNGNLSTTSFVISAFVKKINHASFFMQVVASGVGDNLYVYYNIDTGATSHTDFTSPGNLTVTKSIENYPDGWFRLVARVEGFSNAALHSGFRLGFAHPTNNSQQYIDSSDEVLVFGAQAEVGDFATSYIPTHESTTSVTRAADFAKITGTNFTDFYNSSEGTLFAESSFADLTTENQATVQLWYSSTEHIGMGYRWGGGGSGTYGFYIRNTADQLYRNPSGVTSNTFVKASLAYKSNDGASSLNGETAVFDDSINLPTASTEMTIGYGNQTSSYRMKQGHIKQLSYYNKRLPNAQLQGLTQQ